MDKLSKEKRSWNMSRVKSKDTKPELYVRSLLHRNGYRFRLHVKGLPGKPDIVLPKYKMVVFVHGCFWHRHAGCKEAAMPTSNIQYWNDKFNRNIKRDIETQNQLKHQGWNVIVIWECELKEASEKLLAKLEKIEAENNTVKQNLKCVDLFAGCGGMSLGFLQAGYSIEAAFDNWTPAVGCYRANFKDHEIHDIDLSDWGKAVEIISPLRPDIIVGGPPCQDFSDAGHRVEGKRAELTIAFSQIIASVKPRFFVMENVPRAQKSAAYAIAKDLFKAANYGLTEKVLDACLCGAPQRRKRFFCIGAIDCKDNFLLEYLNSRLAEKPLTVKEYLKDEIQFDYYYKHPRTYGRRAIFSVNEPAATIRGCNRPLPQNYKKHKNDAADPINIRALTTRELARLQTFPASFWWPDSHSVATQLIGNAVPVALAHFIANAILDYNGGNIQKPQDNFIDWLIKHKSFSRNAAEDVLSRFRRMLTLTGKTDCRVSELESLFMENPLAELPKMIQSQLKRACVLHCEYENYKGEIQDERYQ